MLIQTKLNINENEKITSRASNQSRHSLQVSIFAAIYTLNLDKSLGLDEKRGLVSPERVLDSNFWSLLKLLLGV